jgi:hypothetical protein
MAALESKSPRVAFNGFLVHTVDHCFNVVIAMGTEKKVRIEEVMNLLLDP